MTVVTLRSLFFCLAVACAMPRVVLAQDHGLDEARARWEQLTPEQRAQMRERFERFRKLPPEHREAIADRARFLREAMRRAEERLSPADRARVAALAPALRVEVLRDLAMLGGRDRGERIRGALPDAWRERLEGVPAEERARVLSEMQQKMREHRREPREPGPGSREPGLDPREPGLDPRERGHDRPPPEPWSSRLRRMGLSPEEIARLEALPEPERRRELEKLRPPPRGPEGQHRVPPRESSPAHQRLMEAARPRESDILRFSERATLERRELIAKIVRERVLMVLRADQLATPQEIERLEQLSLDDFRRALREKLAPPDDHHRDGRRGDGPPPGRPQSDGPPPDRPPRER